MSMTKNGWVLAGIDGSELSNSVIDYAIWLTKKGPTSLNLLHTIEHSHHSDQAHHEGNLTPNIKEHLLDELSDEERMESKQLIADGKQILNDARTKAESAGIVELIAKQRHGTLPEALIDLQSQVAIIVIGSKGQDHSGEAKGLGTQLEDAIRVATKPIFIAKSRFKKPKKLMFAYNGSPTSLKALNLLVRESLIHKGLEIHVVSVSKNLQEARNLIEDAESVLKGVGIASTVQALCGDTLSLLTQYQKINNIDITMMGAFSHSKLHGFIFGSFTTRMLLESETQFLLVR